jgi:hypothetical protein
MLNFWFFWVFGFNGNEVHVSKAIKFILIGAHLHIPNIWTFKKNWNLKKNTIMLGTYENIFQFDHSKVIN